MLLVSQSLLVADFNSSLVLKYHAEKICETRKLKSIYKWHFVERKTRVENQTKTRVCVYAQKP